MDQTNAPLGQEEAQEGQINATNPEERPSSTTGSMEKLLQEEGLNIDFPKQGEIRTGVIASIVENVLADVWLIDKASDKARLAAARSP